MNKDNNKKLANVMNRFYKSGMILFNLLILSSLLTACGSGGGDISGAVGGDDVGTKTVTLTWDPSPSEDVAGYKIYYNSGEATFPVGVLGANEGTSPLDVRDTTTSKITGLFNNELYYFTVTAYDINGYESSYSNIVTSLPEGQ